MRGRRYARRARCRIESVAQQAEDAKTPEQKQAFHNTALAQVFDAGTEVELSSSELQQRAEPIAAPYAASIMFVTADLAEWLVGNGLALDWPTYSKGKYDKAQRDAEHAGRGIWAGSYVAPWLFRACIRKGGKPGGCSDDANAHP